MKKHSSINSESMQEAFPIVYQKFFAENDLVISSSVAYSINPAFSWMAGGPCLYQKLPFKGYLGISEHQKRGEIKLGLALMHSGTSNAFVEIDEELNYWEGGFEYLKGYIACAAGTKDFPGITVNLLLEQPENIGFESSLGTMLMSAVMLKCGVLAPDEISMMACLSGDDLATRATKESKEYHLLHSESMKLLRALSHGCAVSGATAYKSVIESEAPLVYWTEERGGGEERRYRNLFPLDISKELNRFDSLQWWGMRLNEIAHTKGVFPLDVVSIFPGASGGSHVDVLAYEYLPVIQSVGRLQKFAQDTLSKFESQDESARTLFLKDIKEAGSYWQRYVAGQTVVGVALLRALIELYRHKVSTQTVREFCETLNAADAINYPFVDHPSKHVRAIVREINREADECDINIGIRTLSSGTQDRCILVFSEKGKMRERIVSLVDKLKESVYEQVQINFASWRDGWGKDGLRVEQFISKGIYSKFIEPDAVRLVQWTKKGEVRTSIVKHALSKDAGRDLLIDMVHEKIQVAGKECTSKELPSQKATVTILDALLSAEGHRLHNRALPESGYTKYLNELQGKIVGPLTALVKKRLKKELNLKIEGSLTDFWVALDPKGFEIGVVKKLG